MQLTINGKVYNFKFGIGFIRELDKKFPTEFDGMKFGFSLQTKVAELYAGNVAALADVLFVANFTDKERVKQAELDSFLETTDELDSIFNDVISELKENNAGKKVIKTMEEKMKKA